MKICVATPDIIGPIRNGGVGTAFLGLCEALRDAGHDVSVFYTSDHYEQGSAAYWKAEFRNRHAIEFIALSDAPPSKALFQPLPGVTGDVARSFRVYTYLKARRDFDIIHFPDYLGIGYFTVMAKAVGLDFQSTPIMVTAHGPLAWSHTYDFATSRDLRPLLCGVFEKFVVEHADALVSPSRFMLDWFADQGWTLPQRAVHAFNRLPASLAAPAAAGDSVPTTDSRVTELVFFGRIEQRKGVYLFIDAVNQLLGESASLLEGVKITFLGKLNQASVPRSILDLRLAAWPLTWSCMQDLTAEQAHACLSP